MDKYDEIVSLNYGHNAPVLIAECVEFTLVPRERYCPAAFRADNWPMRVLDAGSAAPRVEIEVVPPDGPIRGSAIYYEDNWVFDMILERLDLSIGLRAVGRSDREIHYKCIHARKTPMLAYAGSTTCATLVINTADDTPLRVSSSLSDAQVDYWLKFVRPN